MTVEIKAKYASFCSCDLLQREHLLSCISEKGKYSVKMAGTG